MERGSSIICPYCQNNRGHDIKASDGDVLNCGECNHIFTLNVEMVAEFTTRKDCGLSSEDHEWAYSATGAWNYCRNCDTEKRVSGPKSLAK